MSSKTGSVGREKIAEERIRILFRQAEEKFGSDPELSDRYIELAQRIGERTQVRIPEDLKKEFCSNCSTYWQQGKTCRVRLNPEKKLVEYRCLECGEKQVYGY